MTYRARLDQVFDLIDACIRNAEKLNGAAKSLLSSNHFAASSALSVLALEELGKTILCDGLVMARQGSDRAKRFDKNKGDHQKKLMDLDRLPMMLTVWSVLDEDLDKAAFRDTIAKNLRNLQRAREAIDKHTTENEFDFDKIKQLGFYVGLSPDGKIQQPELEISAAIAQELHEYAFYAATSASFLWNRNKTKMKALFEKTRKLDDEGYRALVGSAIGELFTAPSTIH